MVGMAGSSAAGGGGGAGAGGAAAEATMTKAQRKNANRKKKRDELRALELTDPEAAAKMRAEMKAASGKNKGGADDLAAEVGAMSVLDAAAAGGAGAGGSSSEPQTAASDEKKVKNLKKKLRQIDELKAKVDGGLAPSEEQQAKLARRDELASQLAELEAAVAAS